jgi:hypothetical protein
MSRRRHTPEQIITGLQELFGRGKSERDQPS